MKITKYHGMLGALGGGCSILGGVIGWSQAFTNEKPQLIIEQNGELFAYGLIGVGLIGMSTYWLMKVDPHVLKDELKEETEELNETLDKSEDGGKEKRELNDIIKNDKDSTNIKTEEVTQNVHEILRENILI